MHKNHKIILTPPLVAEGRKYLYLPFVSNSPCFPHPPSLSKAPRPLKLGTNRQRKKDLFFFFRRQKDPSARVLALDHRNDCISNSVALACAICAHKYWIYLGMTIYLFWNSNLFVPINRSVIDSKEGAFLP